MTRVVVYVMFPLPSHGVGAGGGRPGVGPGEGLQALQDAGLVGAPRGGGPLGEAARRRRLLAVQESPGRVLVGELGEPAGLVAGRRAEGPAGRPEGERVRVVLVAVRVGRRLAAVERHLVVGRQRRGAVAAAAPDAADDADGDGGDDGDDEDEPHRA